MGETWMVGAQIRISRSRRTDLNVAHPTKLTDFAELAGCFANN